MEYNIKSKIEDIKSHGEIYIKISTKKYKHFWVMLPLWDQIKKEQVLKIKLWSCIPPIKSTKKTKELKIGEKGLQLVDYNGVIIDEIGKEFLVDASVPIFVDKDERLKIGDYVTGGFPHTIQAHLVDKEGSK